MMNSETIEVTLGDGSRTTFPKGISAWEVLKAVAAAGDSWVAARVNGNLVDLKKTLEEDTVLEGVEGSSEEGLEILRHSAARKAAGR